MAQSPSHKFGQIIGDVLEEAIGPLLSAFAKEHNLYFDKKGSRPARKGNKVCWVDLYGNKHDLDFVLEKGGSITEIGVPVAFIETAWRRYTKHSRNKAQEIQGAILPLAAAHHNAAPFIGVVIAGDWTSGAISQLRSLGFVVLYFPIETVTAAFKTVGIDADFGEETPDAVIKERVHLWEKLPHEKHISTGAELISINKREVSAFMDSLRRAVVRQIESISVLPLHGAPSEWSFVEDAMEFIRTYDENGMEYPVVRYEVLIRYSTGDRIEGKFTDKEGAMVFLSSYQRPALQPSCN